MISLSDRQLDIISEIARALPVEKRRAYLERIAADLTVRHGPRFTDADVSEAAQAALASLTQHSAA
jgi:hypothetical protein